MKFDFEWQDAPGVRDPVLAATWARLTLSVDGCLATEAIDLRSSSRRTGVYGSVFPLAEWLVENWWQILYEPSLSSPLPPGRDASPWMRAWVQRHNLLLARDGGALPDLTIVRDGGDIVLQLTPDPASASYARVRFVGKGTFREPPEEFEGAAASFVEAVLARLEEQLSDSELVRDLREAWGAIRSSDAEERELCRSLALMGVDPYDAEEATDSLISLVERSLRKLPESLRTDLLEGADSRSFEANLSWVEEERVGLRADARGASFPTIEPVSAPTAHETGYLTAQRLRSTLLGIPDDQLLPDLVSPFTDRLGWIAGCSKPGVSRAHLDGRDPLDGIVGLDDATSSIVLIKSGSRSPAAERFRLARAAFFPATGNLGVQARLLTKSAAYPQRAARAFAAELLAPAAALAKRVSGRLNDQDLDELAAEFEVSPLLIEHQVENHGLGYVGV